MVNCSSATTMATAQGCRSSLRLGTVYPDLTSFSSYEGTQIGSKSRSACLRKLNHRVEVLQWNGKHTRISRRDILVEGNGSTGATAADKWSGQQLCLRNGIGLKSRGLRYSPWRSVVGSSRVEVVLESSGVHFDMNALSFIGFFLSLRATLTEASVSSALADCCKWMLSVAIAVSINFLPWSTGIATAQNEFEGSGCDDVSQYYSQASGLEGEKLKSKLHEIVAGHKRLSYAQVWNALKILDAADNETPEASPDIVDIYSLKRVPKSLSGKSEGWNREHLWPRSYGLMEDRPEFTDVHNLRPADVNVNSSRGNKYFGDCTTLKTTRCLIPANREAAADTATDSKTWRPPTQVRGDIARALFYMAVRYGIEQPSGSLDLQLSDLPSVGNATMGLLSTLLQWNNLDPPSTSEVLRNSRVCSLYQGNRNPFVDHPEYAASIWGAPQLVTGSDIPELPNAGISEVHITTTKAN